jgi:hypothetical protein
MGDPTHKKHLSTTAASCPIGPYRAVHASRNTKINPSNNSPRARPSRARRLDGIRRWLISQNPRSKHGY